MSPPEDKEVQRIDQLPVLYVRGTHNMVGYTIGRQFKNLIENLLSRWEFFNKVLLPLYLSTEGKKVYDDCLALCTKRFPQYVKELEGMAEGAQVPFYKLFLLHIDSQIAPPQTESEFCKKKGETGCTTAMCNNDDGVIIGHTEDAYPEFLNNVYIVAVEIVGESGEKIEKFTTLTYAGYLPGYTMGFNEHGLIYTVNTIFPEQTYPTRTPRSFVARAILAAANFQQVVQILQDVGHGISDGFCLNIHFAKQEGSPVVHNVEVGPNSSLKENSGSELSVLTLTHGEYHVHCNKYLRLKIPEKSGLGFESSIHRHKAIGKHLKPNTIERIKEVLSDDSDSEYPVFRSGAHKSDNVKTVAVGIFDIPNRQWLLYLEPPTKSLPIAILPLNFYDY